MSKMVFLDTNIYLHYQLFDQIDWLEIVKANAVTIVIPPITVRELNKHKELHPRPRVKKRAGKVLKKLFALFESGSQAHLRDDIDVWLEDRDPIDFAAYQLSYEIQDDHLIASIIMCQNEMPEAEIVLVTSDAGLTLTAKAKRQGIATIKLPDDLKLAEEPDPRGKEIRELKQELHELRHKTPELSLTFEDGSQQATFVFPHPVELTQEKLENKLKEIEQHYPKMEEQSKQSGELPEPMASIAEFAASLSSWDTVSPEDIVEYNAKLDEFYQAYARYLQKDVWFQNLKRRTVKLAILLANDGTAPAEDIDVFMHFPDGFGLTREQGFPKPPKPPQPPSKPRTQTRKLLETMNWSVDVPLSSITSQIPIPEPIFSPPNVSAPNIKRTDSYDVDFHVQRIKHKLQESLEALYLVFESFESAHSFHIDYEILAANVPDEVTGKLHVIIRKD